MMLTNIFKSMLCQGNGGFKIDMGDMLVKLVEKVEELLYTIEQQKV